MNKTINPEFKETNEQRKFRQTYMLRVHAAYRFHESLGIMDLGEEKKISLQDIYVPLRFSKQELDENRDWEKQGDTHSIIDILKRSRHVVLSGSPGSGKTTISRMIINLLSTRALTGFAEHCGRRIPLYFKLRDYNIKNIESGEDLLYIFIIAQGATLKFEISRELVEFYLKQGWCFLIFDGVDEVGGLKNRLKIRKFILEYFTKFNAENYLLVTSRPSGLENAPFSHSINKKEEILKLKWLSLFYVDSFNKSQAQDFSLKWFALREENPQTVKNKADEFIHDIEKITSLSVLKRRPVYITMMAHIHTTKSRLPHSRAMAYEYMVQAYIEILDNTRRLHKTMYKEEEFIEWSFDDKIRLLQGIAYKFHTSEKVSEEEDEDEKISLIVVDRKELLKIIESIIEENRERWETIQPDHAEQLLKFYLTRTGLLHEPEEGKIQFSHLSFQEFLTARFIYKRIIEENLFKAFSVIQQEIMKRLNQNRWQETILLFFSLNKEATNDILKLMEKEPETQKKGEMYESFHDLVLEMLDSEEYGIKDRDMDYWVKKVIRFIAMIDSCFDKALERDEYRRSGKVLKKIKNFFRSADRKIKIESSQKSLNELFDEYFDTIQKDSKDRFSKNSLENILYLIAHRKNLAKALKTKLKDALPVLLDRKRFDTQFLACWEIFASYFREFSEYVFKVYTFDEAIVCRDFNSPTVYIQFSKDDKKQNCINHLLELEWLTENIYSYSALNNIKPSGGDFRSIEKKELEHYQREAFHLFISNDYRFWRKNWINELWNYHFSDLKFKQEKFNIRFFSKFVIYNYLRTFEKRIPVVIEEILESHNINYGLLFRLREKGGSVFSYKVFSLISIFLIALSDLEFNQNYRKIENPWKSYKNFDRFYNLICNPEGLYEHLCQICSDVPDKKMFISQYKEYDDKPYSMRKMAKYILDKGKENYPAFSSEEALEKSVELLKKARTLLDDELRRRKRKKEMELA